MVKRSNFVLRISLTYSSEDNIPVKMFKHDVGNRPIPTQEILTFYVPDGYK